MKAIYIEITATKGSAPRDSGTAMRVTPRRTTGTIGGGALEYLAIATARAMLADGRDTHTETLPLGPNLGQCCGGVVTLHYGTTPRPLDQITTLRWRLRPDHPQVPLWLWGTGHVGRAVIRAAPAQAFALTAIDTTLARLPRRVPDHVHTVPARDMVRLAGHAPGGVHHLIFTHSHQTDLALCAALLKRDAASIGLIGSATKWARFSKRLREMGLDPGPITCPIGDKSLGKTPDQIAKGTIEALLARARASEDA